MNDVAETASPASSIVRKSALGILLALSFSHMINDTLQALIPAVYPMLKDSFHLTFTQIGLITLTYQMTASLLQPVVGIYTDRRPIPYSLAFGMGFTLVGLVMLSRAPNFEMILISAAIVGTGSSVFHPEASRVAHMAAGGRHGFAQSLFQVGGNFGTSLGALAAWIVARGGQSALAWISLLALVGIFVLVRVGQWCTANLHVLRSKTKARTPEDHGYLPRRKIGIALTVLILLIISKYFYLVSFTNYYLFYLKDRFHLSLPQSQMCLFAFLFAVAAGTIAGGPLGDRFGRKRVIWVSILGVAPFSLVLPHLDLAWTIVFSMIAGALLASAFPAILVFAQELLPGNVGTIAGLFFGFAFGVSGIASAALGKLADFTSIEYVFLLCGYFPLMGVLTVFLPDLRSRQAGGK